MNKRLIAPLSFLLVSMFQNIDAAPTTLRGNDFNENNDGFILTPAIGVADLEGPESAFTNVPGGSSVRLKDAPGPRIGTFVPSDNGQNEVWHDPTTSLRFAFDFMQQSGSSNSTFRLMDDQAGHAVVVQLRRLGTDEIWIIWNGGDNINTGLVLQLQKWYHIELILVPETNPGDDTFQFIIWDESGNVLLNDTFPFRRNVDSYGLAEWNFGTLDSSDAEFYIDNIIVEGDPGEVILPPPPSEGWAGYDVSEAGDVDTQGFIGWLNVLQSDWVWSYSLSSWLYLPESHVSETGAWTYVPRVSQ